MGEKSQSNFTNSSMAAAEDNNLPSLDDFLVEEDLPSIEDYLEKEEEEVIIEEVQTIEDVNGDSFAEVKDIVPPWPELLRLINDVREEIPQIPEIKYYDAELEKLCEIVDGIKDSIPEIPEFPEVKYYDKEIEAICEQVDLVRAFISEKIDELPEVKYYDEQVKGIEDRIESINQNIATLPQPKYYEDDLSSLKEDIENVKNSIPTFPKWVNEVNEVPDFSWIGKTFSVIDDDFIKVTDRIDVLRETVDYNLKELSEDIDKKRFEGKVELNTKSEEIENKIQEEKDKIWKELRESSLKIWEYHKEFKDDDKKLKKQILGEYNSLKQSLSDKINQFNENSVKTDKLLLNYFEDLKKEISNIPEIKYYDDEIRKVSREIKEIRNLVSAIKLEQKVIQESLEEGLLNEPPDEKESVGGQEDPLTPMDQKFATLDDLAGHYRLFINRIQQQIATIGGGGAGFIKDLDDVTFDAGIGTNKLLIYNGSKWVGIASTALSGTTSLVELTDVDDSNLGDGRFLRYDASAEEFTFEPVSATNLELIAGDIQSGILTTTSTDASAVMTISASTYRSVNYQIQVTRGTNYNMTTINVIHDGTDTYMTEYGTINQPVGIATFSSDISGGSLRLIGHPSSSSDTTFKVIFTALQV
tara:strand:+ start:118 stop:2043 length:1926 start_codon:yes stop_codon:yes gene_type:complete